MNIRTLQIRKPVSLVILGLVLGAGVPLHAKEDPETGPGAMIDLSAITKIDSDLLLIRQQQELFSTLYQITEVLEQMRGYRSSLAALVDENIDPARRWEVALNRLPPDPSLSAAPQFEEILILREEIGHLRNEVFQLQQGDAGGPDPDPTESVAVAGDENGTAVEAGSGPGDWLPERADIRYVQLAGEDRRSTVTFVDSDGRGVQVDEGTDALVRNHRVRVRRVAARDSGHLHVDLEIDGTPHSLVW